MVNRMFWKRHPKKFFTAAEQERIIEEIRLAEKQTSGEIRIHLDRRSEKDVIKKAQKVFNRLDMNRTQQRNGVLIYLATDHRKFAILGDEGIHRLVPENYWEEIKEEMQRYFREGKFCEGLCWGIRQVGEKLRTYFPIGKDDRDELPNTISESE
jgi:uncharacterized membrane protein